MFSEKIGSGNSGSSLCILFLTYCSVVVYAVVTLEVLTININLRGKCVEAVSKCNDCPSVFAQMCVYLRRVVNQ